MHTHKHTDAQTFVLLYEVKKKCCNTMPLLKLMRLLLSGGTLFWSLGKVPDSKAWPFGTYS